MSDISSEERFVSRENELIQQKEKIWRNKKLLDIAAKHVDYDFKKFVDLPLKRKDAPGVVEVLKNLLNEVTILAAKNDVTPERWQHFVDSFFESIGSDIEACKCPRTIITPFLERQLPANMNAFREYLINIFDELHVRCVDDAISSLIYLPHPFVVPGGRFREAYYWDTYWTCLGLNLCGRLDSARGMIDNFVHLISTLGFVPNGNRVYYTGRSQPPMLTEMVASYLAATTCASPCEMKGPVEAHEAIYAHACDVVDRLDDPTKEWLASVVPALRTEYEWWMKNRGVVINEEHVLNVYYVKAEGARPEMHQIDILQAEDFEWEDKGKFHSYVQTVCESGWDFSSRWEMKDEQPLIPVDLNSILHRVELHLAAFDTLATEKYILAAAKRRVAVHELLQTGDGPCLWEDYGRSQFEGRREYACDYWPLWGGLATGEEAHEAVFRLTVSPLLTQRGVVTGTITDTGNQWDYPNIWAPLQHIIVEGLRLYNYPDLSEDIAQRFLKTCYHTYCKDHAMYEKYSAEGDCSRAEGGEYEVQMGFGWTNGVVLDFLNRLNDEQLEGINKPS